MKIFIAASWLKLGGGVTRTLLELFKHIDYSKHDVTLMLMELDESVLHLVPKPVKVISSNDSFQTAGSGAILKDTLKKGKILTAASYMCNMIDWRLFGNNYRHQQWITKHMVKHDEEYDVAIAYAMMNSIVNKYVIDNVKAKKKILWCHTDMKLYKAQYIKGLEKLYPQFDRINCVSASSRDSLIEAFPQLAGKAHIVYNYIDYEKIRREAEAPVDVSCDESILKLCTVCRISQEKGTDLLVECARMLKEKGFNFVWWVVGSEFDKSFSEKIKEKISEYQLEQQVLLLGEKNPPYPFMRACDIYVQPSRIEGYCTTTNEARILFKPVVTTCVSGSDEQFKNGINGSITEISADAVFNAVCELAENKEKCKIYSDNLRESLSKIQENSFESMIL